MYFVPSVLFLLQIARTVHPSYVDVCWHENKVSFIGLRWRSAESNETCREVAIYSKDKSLTLLPEVLGPSVSKAVPSYGQLVMVLVQADPVVPEILTVDPDNTPSDINHPFGLEGFKEGWRHFESSKISSIRLLGHSEIRDIPKNLINELPSEIKMLGLDGCNLKKLLNGVLNGSHIRELSLVMNDLEYIQEEAFRDTKIEDLDLTSNRLSNIDFFRYLPSHIKNINLFHNRIKSIPIGIFSNLTELNHLDFGDNNIKSLGIDTFRGLRSLTGLYLSGNKLSYLDPHTFDDLSNLEALFLEEVNCSSLPEKIFSKLTNLEQLCLGQNNITSLRDDTFRGLKELVTLDLRDNKLSQFSPKIFNDLEKIARIYLDGNPDLHPIPEGTVLYIQNYRYSFWYGNNVTDLDFETLPYSTSVIIQEPV